MKLNMTKEVGKLERMSVDQLRAKYREVFDEETRSRHKAYFIRRIAWRMQANEEGDISERARRRARELARDADLRVTAPKGTTITNSASTRGHTEKHSFKPSHDERLPMPGTILTRKYKGEIHQVSVLEKGFEYEGEVYRSLSAVAEAVTGSHWNGFLFFGLTGREKRK